MLKADGEVEMGFYSGRDKDYVKKEMFKVLTRKENSNSVSQQILFSLQILCKTGALIMHIQKNTNSELAPLDCYFLLLP